MDDSKFQFGEAPTTQSVPQDHEPANGLVDDTDDLQTVEANHDQRRCEAAWGEDGARIARGALRELSPTIIALARRLEQIRSAEIERYRRKLGALEPAQHRAVEALTRGILNRILHSPVRELKAHAGAPEQHTLAQLVRRMFEVA